MFDCNELEEQILEMEKSGYQLMRTRAKLIARLEFLEEKRSLRSFEVDLKTAEDLAKYPGRRAAICDDARLAKQRMDEEFGKPTLRLERHIESIGKLFDETVEKCRKLMVRYNEVSSDERFAALTKRVSFYYYPPTSEVEHPCCSYCVIDTFEDIEKRVLELIKEVYKPYKLERKLVGRRSALISNRNQFLERVSLWADKKAELDLKRKLNALATVQVTKKTFREAYGRVQKTKRLFIEHMEQQFDQKLSRLTRRIDDVRRFIDAANAEVAKLARIHISLLSR
ncbi:MAG: hypothetical protein HYX48_03980 [Chlamydiales bacterium]|nr:hypothetical protein [Chlamydiales bacterium]